MDDWLPVLGPLWALLGVTIVGCAVMAGRHARALRWGCVAVSFLWVVAGAGVNAALLATGRSYAGFADGSAFPFVQEAWESIVVPHQGVFIGMLVGFEATAGLLVLAPGRYRQVALGSLIVFTALLVSFGWAFLLWSLPIGTALAALLRAERRRGGVHPQPSMVPR